MRIWDLVLLEGEVVIYSVAVAVLKIAEKQALLVLPDEAYGVIKQLAKVMRF